MPDPKEVGDMTPALKHLEASLGAKNSAQEVSIKNVDSMYKLYK